MKINSIFSLANIAFVVSLYSISVQTSLLKMLEDGEVPLKKKSGEQQSSVKTKHILFIFSGAFNLMNEQLSGAHPSSQATVKDFINAGLEVCEGRQYWNTNA